VVSRLEIMTCPIAKHELLNVEGVVTVRGNAVLEGDDAFSAAKHVLCLLRLRRVRKCLGHLRVRQEFWLRIDSRGRRYLRGSTT